MIRECSSYPTDRRGTLAAGLVLAAMAAVPMPLWGQWNGANPLWTNSNVGIGTQFPAGKLHVANGNLVVSGDNSQFMLMNANGWTQAIVARSGAAQQAAFIATPYGAYSATNPYWAMGLTGIMGNSAWGLETWDGTTMGSRRGFGRHWWVQRNLWWRWRRGANLGYLT